MLDEKEENVKEENKKLWKEIKEIVSQEESADKKRVYWFGNTSCNAPNEEAMIARLLDDGQLFCNSRKYIDDDNKIQPETLVLFLNCNDIFVWGCADAEEITLKELPELFKLYEKNQACSLAQWVCIKRNQKPQKPMEEWLKENNGWNGTLEVLPENEYEIYLKEERKDKNEDGD